MSLSGCVCRLRKICSGRESVITEERLKSEKRGDVSILAATESDFHVIERFLMEPVDRIDSTEREGEQVIFMNCRALLSGSNSMAFQDLASDAHHHLCKALRMLISTIGGSSYEGFS